jgi:hypothetical protein
MIDLCRPGLFAALALLPFGATLPAQSPIYGAVHGIVRDPRSADLAGATMTLEETGSSTRWVTIVSADGSFFQPHLAPGTYVLALRLQGAAAAHSEPMSVSLGEVLEVRATVAPGGTVAFSAQPAVATSTVPEEPLPDADDDGLGSAHGLTALQNTALIDGASATQSYASVPVGTGSDPAPDPDGDPDSADETTGPANGLARGRHAGIAYVFSQAAVREFRVVGQSYSAQAGHAGEVATMVSRSGGKSLHGSGFFVVRSQAFAASSPLAIATSYSNGLVTSGEVKPHDLRENFGASLGGPVPRLRNVTFFYTIDQQLRGFPAVSSPADPAFYSLTATQSTLLAVRGVTAAGVNAALNYLSSLTGLTPRRADQTLNFIRLDWQSRPRVSLALEYNAVRWTSPAGLIDAPVVARGRASLGNAAGSLDMVLLRATERISARTIHETRVGFTRDVQYETPQTPLAQEPAISPGGLAPEVDIAPNGLLFGTPATLSQQRYPDERRLQLADTLTLVRGHHLIEAGAEWTLVDDAVATLTNAAGTFSYDSGVTNGSAGGLVDFITDSVLNVHVSPDAGCPSLLAVNRTFCFRSYSQSFGEQSVAFSTQNWAGFVEDTWRPWQRLTLHAGARYEYTLLPVPYTPNLALDAVFGSRGATSVFPEDRNNLGPRAAVAYEPFGAGKGLVKAGFGLFFGRLPGATIQSALTNTALPSSTTRIRIRPSAIVGCPQVANSGFGYPCAFATAPSGVVAQTTSAMVFDRRFRLPVVEQGSLSLQREVLRGTRLTATYVLNLDRQLPGSRDLNIAPSTSSETFQLQGGTGAAGVRDGETFVLPLYTSRVTPSFGPVTDIVSDVNGSYNGLTLGADSREGRTLQVRAEYSWSKAIDFGQNQSAIPRTNGQLDPFTNGYDKGLSSLNYPWALRAQAAWTPVVHRGEEWIRRAANGWGLALIVAARSGRPYSLDLSGGTDLAGGHESLNGSGGALYLPSVGRNTMRLPASVTVDLRAARGFRVGSRMRALTSVEAFNLLNHMNVSSVQQRAYLVGTPVAGVTPLVFQNAANIAAEGLNTQPFGTPTSAATSLTRERQVQLSLRVEF